MSHTDAMSNAQLVRHALRQATLPIGEWEAVENAWDGLLSDAGLPSDPIRTDESEPEDHDVGT